MLIIFFILVFFVSFFIVSILIKISLHFNIVDDCNNHEADLKIHKKPIPVLGGLAVLFSWIIGISTFLFFPKDIDVLKILVILCFGMFISILSLLDDCKQIHFLWRLTLQIIAAIFLVLVNIKLFFISIHVFALSFFFTIFYLVAVINSFNMIDGMDGLCSGVSIISCIGFFILGIKFNNLILIIISFVLFAALVGFLPYNFHPAKIFLGDNGSTFIGFLLGTMAVISTSYAANIKGYLIPLLILGVPFFDMVFAIFRRLKNRRSIFMGDRGHIYDLLLKRNLSQRKVFLIICLIQILFLALALFLLR